MKAYPDPHEFFEKHMEQAVEKRIEGMKRAGITQPSQKLVNRLIERDIETGKQRYTEETEKVFKYNMKLLKRNILRARLRHTSKRLGLPCSIIAISCAYNVWHFHGTVESADVLLLAVSITMAVIFLILFVWSLLCKK